MARFCALFSGSSGNSCFIGTKDSGILVDAGVSSSRIMKALLNNGIMPNSVKAIFITHEHCDHIKGLAVLSKQLRVPVIASKKTLDAILRNTDMPQNSTLIEIDSREIEVDGICACRFPTSHDCQGSSGYSFLLPFGQKISICTDLGTVTDDVRHGISGSDLIMIESNHDLKMLKNGPYPPILKIRIMSDTGHLSNNACAAELPQLLSSGTTRFVLGHLSRHNNLPLLASTAATDSLLSVGARRDEDYILKIAAEEGGQPIII